MIVRNEPGAEGTRFFSELVRDYLNIPGVIGIQSSAGAGPDLLLFEGPRRQTLAVPLSLLFEESKESAREFIAEKMTASNGRFADLQPAFSAEAKPWKSVKEIRGESAKAGSA